MKCARPRVYGESVWFDVDSVDNWCSVGVSSAASAGAESGSAVAKDEEVKEDPAKAPEAEDESTAVDDTDARRMYRAGEDAARCGPPPCG